MREKIFARACRHLLDRRRRGGAHSPIGLLAYADKEQAKKAEEAIRSIHDGLGLPRSRRPEGGQDHHRARSGHRHLHKERAWTACRDCLDQAPVEDRIRRPGPSGRKPSQHRRPVRRELDPTSQAHAWLRADDACSRQTARQGASDQARRRRPSGRYCQARAARSPQTRHRCRAWLPRRYRY